MPARAVGSSETNLALFTVMAGEGPPLSVQ
jgi:hypothetical protein